MGKKELSDFIFSSLYESIGLFFKAIMLHALRRKSIIITMKTVCRKAPYCVCYVLSMRG